MTLQAIREAIAANLSTISGLRTSAFVPDNPNPPVAIVIPRNIAYDSAFQRGADELTLDILLIGHRMSERTAQNTLDSYVQSSGSTSVKAAVESDRTLSGAAFDVRVTDLTNYGPVSIGETQYLSATFSVSVITN